MQLYEEKLRKILEKLKQRMNSLMQKEKIRRDEFKCRPLTIEEGFHYCEP